MTNKRKYVIISLKLKKERINKKMKIINYTVELTKYNNKGISVTQLNNMMLLILFSLVNKDDLLDLSVN